MIDLAFWLCGEIVSIRAELATMIDRFGPDGKKLLKNNDTASTK